MAQDFDTQEFLDGLPSIEELKAKAQEDAAQYTKPSDFPEERWKTLEDGLNEYHWTDYGGQSTSIFFTNNDTQDTLVLVYDHECSTNFYDDDSAAQVALYEGIPENLKALIVEREEDYFNLAADIFEDEVEDESWGDWVASASGVAWYSTETGWQYSPKFDELRTDDGGWRYCMRPLLEGVNLND